MWGPPSQLNLSYEIRHMRRFKDKHQRPLTDKEKEILDRIKKVDPNNFGKKCKGLTMPQLNILKEYDLPQREKRVILDEVEGLTGNDRAIRPPIVERKKQINYLDLLRCGGKTDRLAAKKKKEKNKKKTKYRSYTEARKDREKFRKRLVEVIMHRDEWDDEDAEPASAGAPLTTKEKDLLRYYYYIHNGIDTRFVAAMNQKWFKRIMAMVPRKLLRNQREIRKIHDEIKEDYLFAVKKSIVDFVLKEPEIDEDERFLDEDDETPLTIELAAVSNAWKKPFRVAKKYLRINLHPINQCFLQTLTLWYKEYNNIRFVNTKKLAQGPKMEMMHFQDFIYQDVERVKTKFTDDWLNKILEIYRHCEKKRQLPPDQKKDSFMRSLAVQMTLSIQNLTLASMKDFDIFISGLNNPDKLSTRAGFVMTLKIINNHIVFQPPFADIENALLDTYDTILRGASEIPRFEYALDPDEDEKPVCLKPTILKEIIDKAKQNVRNVVGEQMKGPESYVKEYDKFMYLIDGRCEEEINKYIEESHTFDEFVEKVNFFVDLGGKINNNETLPKEVNLGMFQLHCEDLISNLARKTTVLRELVLKKMSQDHQDDNKRLCTEYEDISNTALSSPSNTEELVKLKQKVLHIQTVTMKEKERDLMAAGTRLVFLSDYLQFTTAEMKLNTKTFQWHAKMPEVFEEHNQIIKDKTMEYQKALKLRRERFIEELETYNHQVDDFYTFGNVDELPKYMKKAQTLNTKLELCREKIEQFNMEENAFEWELTNYPLMQATVDKLNPFLGLYETSMEFMNKQKTWFESPMGTHDPKDIDAEVNSSWKLVSHLENEFCDIPAAKELVVNVREKIEEFKSKMPVIRTLGNPGFRDRHWENVSNTVGFPVKGGSNLFQILDMGLDEYVAKFEKISDAATKEFDLEKSMEKMVEEWADMEFTIAPYGETGTYTLSSMDSIQILLDDHIVKTQTMRGSPHIKPFEEQIAKWEAKLLNLQEIMDEWLKVQSIWLYLEPIFAMPDIMAQMPEEGRRFTTVDKNWRDIMKAAIVDKHVLAVVEIDRILEKLKKSNELLDLIGKGLNDYLERKRQCFPRFFFLSNSELLEILSETKDPTRVQPHLKKCFEGIAKLDFDEELEVVKMKSQTDETIPLVKKISTVKARGQVDKWLAELEIQMKLSLKQQIEDAMKTYDDMTITESVNRFPSQVLMCVNYIYWTTRIEIALRTTNNKEELQKVKTENETYLDDLAKLVLSETDKILCQTYANLILSQGYYDIIMADVLAEKSAVNEESFPWQSRLRYYWSDDEVMLRMMHSELIYGYEYLTAYTKLVMTPLTERCYRILLMAMDLHRGGLISGQTATGKTETVKDLAKAVAKQCVAFNCSENVHYNAFAKFLKGLASCGAWSCFDEFHRIDIQVLSVIAHQILSIQRAIQAGMTQMSFEDSEIKISVQCAVFVTTESLQDHDVADNIPDNLKVLFRPVAMFNPDFGLIAELMLKSFGFDETKVLSQKLASMVDLCDGLLSSQAHYEFGLRSIISILRAAGELKKMKQDEDEHYIMSQALQTVKYCELLPQDQEMFKKILDKVFNKAPPDPLPDEILAKAIEEQCLKNDLEPTPHFLSKVQQLLDMMELSDGVMLLGESYGGKTKALKTLAASLQAAQGPNGKAPSCVILNPKAMKIDQLYGWFDADEWKDGILATSFRTFASLPENERKWLVFDGPVDSEWIENMNTVLDENKKLCLMSGEIIALPPKTNLIFEAQDVESASPATISRCGVLYMDSTCLHWNLLVKTWIKTFPRFIPDSIKEKLTTLFDRFCIPLLGLVRRKATLKISRHHLIASLIKLFDCYLNPLIKSNELKGKSETELNPLFEGMFFFSCIWTLGAVCDKEGKTEFSLVFHELLKGDLSQKLKQSANITEDILPLDAPYTFPLPRELDCFSFKLSITTKAEWQKWDEEVDTAAALPRDIFACQLIIPTAETAKYCYLMKLFVENSKPFLLIGASGTGKSAYVKDLLNRLLDKDKFASTCLYFTSNTNPTNTQDIVMSKLDKRRKGVYGPPLGKKFIVFVDDINMPDKDDVDSQPSIELLRQLLDHQIWYDSKELFTMKLIEMVVVGAMRPPDGSSKAMTGRFIRHFNTINIDLFQDHTITSIFSRIVLWHLDTKGFAKEFDPCIDQVVTATLDVHKFVVENLLPTPDHSHYLFSLKEFSRVICGVLLSVPETMEDLNAMKRLWVHEVFRVYFDRLVWEGDQDSFVEKVTEICDERLKIGFSKLCARIKPKDKENIDKEDMRKLLFCDFCDTKNDEKFYKEVTDINKFRQIAEDLLVKYNEVSRKPMDLTLFDFAMEHLCRISRVLKQPESHTMIVGVGGSGRQSLSRLATHISGYEFYQFEMGKDDGFKEWRDNLKNVLKKTSLTISQNVLFLYENQMHDLKFMEDINNILYSGEVPNIFTTDERQEIIENMRNLEKQLDKSKHTDGSGPELFKLFIQRAKENFHVVLAMSPISDTFRSFIAKFPGLMACCTINWMHQWPDDALNFVAYRFLGDIEFKTGELEGCVELCEHFHNSTIALSKEVRWKYSLYNYVTPASYLELNILFKKLLLEHREKVKKTKSMYEVSLEKLKGAESQVTVMQAEMAALQPKLSVASKEVDSNMAVVDKEQTEVSELEKIVKGEDTIVNEKKKVAESIRNDCDAELTEVNLVIDQAIDQIAAMTQSEIAAVRGVKTPSICLKLIMEAICLLKNIKPDRIPDTAAGGSKMIDDYWGPGKRILGDPKFVDVMSGFEKDSINAKTMKMIRDKYLANTDINPDKSKSNLAAMDTCARAMYRWLLAIDMYEKVAKNIAPKRESLAKAEADYQESLEQLNKKKDNLREAQDKLKNVHDDLTQKKQKKAELENEVDLCTRKLERAEQLITGFGGEREKWAETTLKLEKKLNQLTGDILLAVGTVAYLGAFPENERKSQVENWQEKASELGVAYSDDYSLQGTLGNQITIQSWYMNGLLRDNLSTDNGIILSTAERWVLMVDPQDIANRWIKTMEKQKNLSVLKQSDKDFLRNLENCIQFGTPVLLENVGESLDPALEPLLQKQTFTQGGSVCIKLGESTIEYSKDFRMYITTRLKNPHFPPETTAKITMVNFSISKAGLIDQLLGIIVARERPELEEERNQIIGQINENKKNLGDIDNKILSVLHSSKGNILEDETAIKTLSSSKVLANEIVEKQMNSEAAKSRIDENRNEYLGLTRFAVTLFFTGNYLSMINHMYQFSLAWFMNLFCTSIDVADKSEELEERLCSVKDHFLRSLFVNTSSSLFEEDKIIYTFLLACAIGKDCSGVMESPDWDFFLKLVKDCDDDPAAVPEWISDRFRNKLAKLNKMEAFTSIFDDGHLELLKKLWTSTTPYADPEYDTLCGSMSAFQKLVFMATFRCDQIVPTVRRFVLETLGESFVKQETLDIGKAFAETSAATPLIMLLKDEVNPCKYIFRFADEMGFQGKKLRIMSMGDGQEDKARETIIECSTQATWVVLLNCHLVPDWMDELEWLCEDLSSDSTNQDFRLWLTTETTQSFSVPTLQLGVKVAIEEPQLVKLSLVRRFFPDKAFIKKFNEKTDKWKKITYAITLFHSCINERMTYDHCGWNQDYIFGEVDYDLCLLHLNSILKSKDFNLDTLQYLIAELTYGGKMEDEWDMRTLTTFLERIFSKLNLNNDCVFDEHGVYHTKAMKDHETLMEYLNELPNETNNTLIGSNSPNTWNKTEEDGAIFLQKVRKTQGLDLKGDDDDDETSIKDKIVKILERTPEEFESKEDQSTILELVLDQELQKYNELIETMRESLETAIRGIDGKCLVTDEIEDFIESIKNDEIPESWQGVAYPTMEDLPGYLDDLQDRIDFLTKWHDDGPPPQFWVTALYEPGDFFIAIMYMYALETKSCFHELGLEVRFDIEADDWKTVSDGIVVRGMYLVGAAWDDSKKCLVEATRDTGISSEMPPFRLVPVKDDDEEEEEEEDEDKEKSTYQMPLFQNADRDGDENFIIDLEFPTGGKHPDDWILTGTALLCQKPIEGF